MNESGKQTGRRGILGDHNSLQTCDSGATPGQRRGAQEQSGAVTQQAGRIVFLSKRHRVFMLRTSAPVPRLPRTRERPPSLTTPNAENWRSIL